MRKLSTDEFKEKAREVHGDRYDYSLVEYVNNSSKVKIICGVHGPFDQRPNSHMLGNGCRQCSYEDLKKKNSSNALEFVNKAKEIHTEKYDYSQVKYRNNKTKLVIICTHHGRFEQTPNDHLPGYGCPQCGTARVADSSRYDTEEFVRKAKLKHGDKYDYTLTKYTSCKGIVDIKCKQHGVFHKRATKHLQGQGCPICSRRRSDMTYIYVLHGEGRTKIGITTNWGRREKELHDATPFSFEIVGLWFAGAYLNALAIEKMFHSYFEQYCAKLSDFHGATEWFDMTPFEACDLLTGFLGVPSE